MPPPSRQSRLPLATSEFVVQARKAQGSCRRHQPVQLRKHRRLPPPMPPCRRRCHHTTHHHRCRHTTHHHRCHRTTLHLQMRRSIRWLACTRSFYPPTNHPSSQPTTDTRLYALALIYQCYPYPALPILPPSLRSCPLLQHVLLNAGTSYHHQHPSPPSSPPSLSLRFRARSVALPPFFHLVPTQT